MNNDRQSISQIYAKIEKEKSQDATPIINGFVYQIYLSILRLLESKPGQIVVLEGAEDVDLIAADLCAPAEMPPMVFEQHKHHAEPLTLGNAEFCKALTNLALLITRQRDDFVLASFFGGAVRLRLIWAAQIGENDQYVGLMRKVHDRMHAQTESKLDNDAAVAQDLQLLHEKILDSEIWTKSRVSGSDACKRFLEHKLAFIYFVRSLEIETNRPMESVISSIEILLKKFAGCDATNWRDVLDSIFMDLVRRLRSRQLEKCQQHSHNVSDPAMIRHEQFVNVVRDAINRRLIHRDTFDRMYDRTVQALQHNNEGVSSDAGKHFDQQMKDYLANVHDLVNEGTLHSKNRHVENFGLLRKWIDGCEQHLQKNASMEPYPLYFNHERILSVNHCVSCLF